MSTEIEKRRRVSDLLFAEIDKKKVAEIVGVSLSTVYVIAKSKKGDNSIARKEGSGGHNKKRDKTFLRDLKTKIEADPTTSMNRLAKTMEVDHRTIRRAVNDDLGLKSYTRTLRHLLTAGMKEKRLARCKKVLNWLKATPSKVMIFSDKKIFTVDQVVNRRNDRFLAQTTEGVKGGYRTKHPQQVMVLGVVASDGKKMPPYMFKPKEKIDQHVYYKVLRYTVLPWLKATYPDGNYVWTQDGAPCHTSDKAQKFCATNMVSYWDKTFWPSNSPDLNPLDFAVWSVLEKETNRTSHPNLGSLKAKIIEEWNKMSPDFIRKSCVAFRPRVEAVIAAEGSHIE